jgi:hypothetical protein
MSTQLILYPQSYKGEYNSIANPSTIEYIVNGINFIGLDSTSLHNTTANNPSEDAIINQPPSIAGNWYRFTTTGGSWGAVSEPVVGFWYIPVTISAVQLSANAVTSGHTGIYQQLSGLIVGAIYDIEISIVTAQTGILIVELYSGTIINHQQQFSSNTTLISTAFTAQTPNDIFLIDYTSTSVSILISQVSIKQSPISPSLIYSELQDGQVICDLYQEEDIPLTLSIDDFKNVAEQVKSYSKDFNLPATKRNNQIFNNMFEITRSDDKLIFNPYIKTQCTLKQDGFILFEGYLRLIDVKDKEGEISYNVNLYSEVIVLADVLKDKIFSELDFSELDHDYNKTSIKQSWDATGLPLLTPIYSGSFAYDAATGNNNTQVLKYPFIDWTHQYLLGPAGTGNNVLPGTPQLMSLEQAFRPCIQLKYLINKIFAASGFNWTSDFFDSTDFGKLFMDFNWGADMAPVVFSLGNSLSKFSDQAIGDVFTTITFDEMGSVGGSYLNSNFGNSGGVFTAQEDGQVYSLGYGFLFEHHPTIGPGSLYVEWVVNGISFNAAQTPVGTPGYSYFYGGSLVTPPLQAGETVFCRAKASVSASWKVDEVYNAVNPELTPGVLNVYTGVHQITTETLLETLRGELGQWDFLKGIMTMFNLVSLVDETNPNNILIEPYADVFINNTNSGNTGNLTLAARSIQHDWTEKVDASEMELKPLTDLNKNTIFQFVEDDDDHVFNALKKAQSGHLYGSLEYSAEGFTILEGTEEIIAEPFAATVSKPIDDQFGEFIVPSIYTLGEDGTTEGFENSPRIFYNNGVKDTGASYYIPAQNTLASENQTQFLQFSHLSDIPTIAGSRDFVFTSAQLVIELGNPPVDNLFNTYWLPYFNELYNADTRTMTLKVNLSPADVASFKFYDTVFIKNRSFRVNKIEYKPNSLAKVEFILIP